MNDLTDKKLLAMHAASLSAELVFDEGRKRALREMVAAADRAVTEQLDPVAAARRSWIGPPSTMSMGAWNAHYLEAKRMLLAAGFLVKPPSCPYFVQTPKDNAYIVQAAVRYEERVYLGWRHSTPLAWLIANEPTYDDMKGEAQGFIDQYGYFYCRNLSAVIAFKAGQIKEACDTLISEQLWSDAGLIYRMPRPFTSTIATLIRPEF